MGFYAVLLKKPIVAVLGIVAVTGLVAIGASFINQLACEGQPINNNEAPTPAQ